MSSDIDPRDPLSVDPTRLVTGQPTCTRTVEEVCADYPHVTNGHTELMAITTPWYDIHGDPLQTAAKRFEPRTLGVRVNMIRDQVTHNPPAVKRVFGRGDWPHQNIIFVHYTSMWEIVETKMCSAYYTMGAHLEMVKYFGDEEAVRQAKAKYDAEMKEWNRWYRRLVRLPHRLHEWYADRTWRTYMWRTSSWYTRLRMIVMGKGQRRWKL
jgi:hypothetical protein